MNDRRRKVLEYFYKKKRYIEEMKKKHDRVLFIDSALISHCVFIQQSALAKMTEYEKEKAHEVYSSKSITMPIWCNPPLSHENMIVEWIKLQEGGE